MLMGKILHPKQNKSTGGLLLGLRNGDAKAIAVLKMFGTQWMVDVVDVAKLHVIALVDPAVRYVQHSYPLLSSSEPTLACFQFTRRKC